MNDIFIKTAQLIGSFPSSFSDKNPKLYTTFSIVNILVIVGIATYPIIDYVEELITSHYSGKYNADLIMEIAIDIIYALFVVHAILFKNIIYIKDCNKVKSYFREIDVILKQKLTANFYNVLIKYVVYHLLFFVFIVFRYNVFLSIDYTIIDTILTTWLDYAAGMDIIIGWRILVNVRIRLKYMNTIIKKLHEPPIVNVAATAIQKRDWKIKDENTILELIEAHARLVHIIQIFNKLFGASIVLLNMMFFVEFLAVVLRIIAVQESEKELYLDLIGAISNLVCLCFRTPYI